jgi:hypothetical protein
MRRDAKKNARGVVADPEASEFALFVKFIHSLECDRVVGSAIGTVEIPHVDPAGLTKFSPASGASDPLEAGVGSNVTHSVFRAFRDVSRNLRRS